MMSSSSEIIPSRVSDSIKVDVPVDTENQLSKSASVTGNNNRDSNSSIDSNNSSTSTNNEDTLLIKRDESLSFRRCGPREKRFACYGFIILIFLTILGMGIDLIFAWKRNFVTANINQVNVNLGSHVSDVEIQASVQLVLESRFHSADAKNKEQLCDLYIETTGINGTAGPSILLTTITGTSTDTIKPMSFFSSDQIDARNSLSTKVNFNQVNFEIIRTWIGNRQILAPLHLKCSLNFNVNAFTFIPIPVTRSLTYDLLVNTTLIAGYFDFLTNQGTDTSHPTSAPASASDPGATSTTKTSKSISTTVSFNNTITNNNVFETDYKVSIELASMLSKLSFPVFIDIPDIDILVGYAPGSSGNFSDQVVNWHFFNRRMILNLAEEELVLSSFAQVSCYSNNVPGFDQNCSLASPLLFLINSILHATSKSDSINAHVLVNFSGQKTFITSLATRSHELSLVSYSQPSDPSPSQNVNSAMNIQNGRCLRTAFDSYLLSDFCYETTTGNFEMHASAVNVASLAVKALWRQSTDGYFYVSFNFNCQISYLPFSLFGLKFPVSVTSSLLLDQSSRSFNAGLNVQQRDVNLIRLTFQLLWPDTTMNIFRSITSTESIPFALTTAVIFRNRLIFDANTAFAIVSNDGVYLVVQDFGYLGGEYVNGDWNIGGMISDTGSSCDLRMNSTLVVPSISQARLWEVEGQVKFKDGMYIVQLMDTSLKTGFNVSGSYNGAIGQSWNVTVKELALLARGSLVLSVTGQLVYSTMNDGSIGQLLFYAAEHSKTKLFPSGSTTNLVSWNIHRDSSQASSVIMASEVNQVMAPPIGYSKQLVQPKPFWALSSRCEYGSGSFFATALETVTNSHVETAGQYSFKGARDWGISVTELTISLNNGKLWSSDFIVSIQCHLPQDTKAGLLSVDVKLIFFSSFVVSIADSLSWNLDMNSRNPSIVVASRYRVFSENPSAAPTVEPTSEPSSDPTFHPTIMPMSSHFFLSPSLAPISLAPTLGDYWWWWASSRSSRSSSSSWYNGTGVLDFYKSVSTDGLKSTAFTGRLEEAASRLMLTGAGFLSGHLDNWLLVLTTSALSIRDQLVGSLTSQIRYTVPTEEGGLVGLIEVDVQPIWGTSLAINTSSALQWDLSAKTAGVITLGSDATSTSVVMGLGSSPFVQPESLWSLSSRCEYDGSTFHATASEPVTNSLIETSGLYTFNAARDWSISVTELIVSLHNGQLWSTDFTGSIQCYLPQDTATGLLSIGGADRIGEKNGKLAFSSANTLSWNLDIESPNPGIVISSRLTLPEPSPTVASGGDDYRPMQWLVAQEYGESCDSVCASRNRVCDANSFSTITSAQAFRRLIMRQLNIMNIYCDGIFVGSTTNTADPEYQNGVCFYGGGVGDCSTTSTGDGYRICPCSVTASPTVEPSYIPTQPTVEPTTSEPIVTLPTWFIATSNYQSCDNVCSSRGRVCDYGSFSSINSAEAFRRLVIDPMGYQCAYVGYSYESANTLPFSDYNNCYYGDGLGDCSTVTYQNRFCPCAMTTSSTVGPSDVLSSFSSGPSSSPSNSLYEPSIEPSIEPSTEPTLETTLASVLVHVPTRKPTYLIYKPSRKPVKIPTQIPTHILTRTPSHRPLSSLAPTPEPGNSFQRPSTTITCPAFSASNTNSAIVNFATCKFSACGGLSVFINSVCSYSYSYSFSPGSVSCNGNIYIRVISADEVEVESAYGGSFYEYETPRSNEYEYGYSKELCQEYSLHQGCYGSESCSNQFQITVYGSITSTPTSNPSIIPTSPTAAPVTSSPSIVLKRNIWNGTGVLNIYKSVSTDGLKSTAFTGRLEEAASRFVLSGAGFLSGHLNNWLLVLTTSALSIREQLVGSLAARISYTVPLAESGLVGLIKADVQPIWGTSLAVNTSSALQWDLSAQNTGVITLGSDATSVKLGRGSSPLVQPESLWTLSSRCEYGSGSFHATASETVSNSLVDTSGLYSFQDSKNWSLAVTELVVLNQGIDVVSGSGDVHICIPDLARDGSLKANLLSRKGITMSSSNELLWKFGKSLAYLNMTSRSGFGQSQIYKIDALLDADFISEKHLKILIDYIPRNKTQLLAEASMQLNSDGFSSISADAIWNSKTLLQIISDWMYNTSSNATPTPITPTMIPSATKLHSSSLSPSRSIVRKPTKSPHFPTSLPSFRPSSIAPTSPTVAFARADCFSYGGAIIHPFICSHP